MPEVLGGWIGKLFPNTQKKNGNSPSFFPFPLCSCASAPDRKLGSRKGSGNESQYRCSHIWSVISDSVTLRTVAHQAPLFMEFSRQEYWGGLPFPTAGDLPDPGIKPGSLALQEDSLSQSHLGSPWEPVLLFSRQVVPDSLWPHGLQHTRFPCPSPSPRVCPSSCHLNQWCHPTISSSDTLFSFCLQSFPASRSFPMSQLFWPKVAKVLELQLQHQSFQKYLGFISFKTDWKPVAT